MNYYDNSDSSPSVGYQPSRYILWHIARNNVPTLVFLKPDGRELSDLRVTGFEPKERMLERMDRVLRLSKDIRENPG